MLFRLHADVVAMAPNPTSALTAQVLLLRPFLSIKAFRDRLLADDGFMNKARASPTAPARRCPSRECLLAADAGRPPC